MSVSSVRSEIQKAMVAQGCDGKHVTAAEMKKIAASAEADGRVVAGEAKQIADLVEKGHVKNPGSFMTLACPEHAGSSFTIDKAAVKEANALFARNKLPYGSNEPKMRAKIEARLEDVELGAKIKKPSLTGLHALTVSDQRPVDGPLTEAYVDPKKNRFFVKVTGSGMGGPATMIPTWHGPISLGADEKKVTTATTKKLLNATSKALTEGVEWNGMPMGARMVRVPLFAAKHPDGYAYAALIPVGALAPGAPMSDPNKAKTFFLERSGGFAGLTQVGGPISIDG